MYSGGQYYHPTSHVIHSGTHDEKMGNQGIHMEAALLIWCPDTSVGDCSICYMVSVEQCISHAMDQLKIVTTPAIANYLKLLNALSPQNGAGECLGSNTQQITIIFIDKSFHPMISGLKFKYNNSIHT